MKNNSRQDNASHAHSRSAGRTPAALTKRFVAGLSLAALSLAAGAAPAAPGALPKTDTALSAAMAAKTQTGSIGVILRTAAPLSAAQEAQMAALGAGIVRRLPIIQSVAVRLPERNLAKLAALPFAVHLSLDGGVQKTDEFTVGSSEAGQAYRDFYRDAPRQKRPGHDTNQLLQAHRGRGDRGGSGQRRHAGRGPFQRFRRSGKQWPFTPACQRQLLHPDRRPSTAAAR